MRLILSLLVAISGLSGLAQDDQNIEIELECSSCHAGGDWTADVGRTFDHMGTGFELEGVHAELNCNLCHSGSSLQEKHDFGRVNSDCNTCHEDIHSDLWGSDCARCHTPESWSLSTQQQNHDLTNFPLRGAHRNLDCSSCHVSSPSQSATLALNCAGCHMDNYNQTVDPSHVTLELDGDCEICHASQSTRWTDTFFNHNDTQFPLIGMHAGATCASCHTGPAEDSPSECQSCHLAEYTSSTNPAHAVAGYPMECGDCHDSFTWNSNFVHDQTGFTLLGVHTETLCSQCHENQNFAGTAQACAGCHLTAWETGESFSHAAAEFALTCEDCHDEVAWIPSTWNHDIDSDYPLTGAHVEVTCMACHLSSPYTDQPSECYACHQATYEATLDPNHITASIPTTCEVCHTTENWESKEIDHSLTAFPLIGAHSELECAVCHSAGYDLPIDCQGCHLQDYTSTSTTSSPDHSQYGFSQDCLICHNQVSWKPSAFDHDPNLTGFEIRGAHLSLLPNDCYACHETATWAGLSSDCGACHQTTFNNTSDPDHETNGFPIILCEDCHSQDAWEPSIFTHESNINSCVTCHLVQYNGTTDPDHEALSFPTDCANCHTVDQWTPATFSHDLETTGFLTDGAHSELSCNTCHANWDPPSEIRSCASASCHQDDFSQSSNPPHETMGFSQECTQCHTTTQWAPSEFTHDLSSTGFLLEEAHTSVACQSCHSTWVILPQPRTCADASCHLTDYQNTTDPDHESGSFPLDCATCHTMTAWEPASFDHDGQYFPIYTGGHRGKWDDCSQCHINSSNYAEFTCFGAGCHNVAELNGDHFDDGAYVSCNGITYSPAVTSNDCFTCHPTGDEDDCEGDLFNKRFRTLPFPKEAGPNEIH